MPLLALACLSLIPYGQGPDLSQKITYSTVAVPASRAITELSQKTGVPLSVSQDVASEILLIHVQDAPLSEVMKRIADATSGRWSDSGGTQVLGADSTLRAQQAGQARQKRIENIQKSIKSQIEERKNRGKEDGRMNLRATGQIGFGRGMSFGGGVDDVLWSVIPRLAVGTLADIPEDGRLVFATDPNRMQRQVPTIDRKLVAEAIKKHNQMVDQLAQHQPENDAEVKMMESLEKMGMNFKPKKISGIPTKILVVVERGGFMEGLNVELKAYSAEGATILNASASLLDGDFMSEMMIDELSEAGEIAVKKQADPPKQASKPIEFSKTTKELVTIMQGSMRGAMAALSDDARKMLLQPDTYDPLSFVTSEAILFIAKDKKINVVADLPDAMSGLGLFGQPESYTIDSYLASLTDSDDVEYEIKDGWFTLRPENPVQSRRERMDRVALTKFLAAANGKESISLDDMGDYALRSEPPMESQITMPYIMAFAPALMGGGFMGMLDWDMLRFYGSSGPSHRQIIKTGGRIPIAGLTGAQSSILNKMVYGADPNLQIRQPGQPVEDQNFFVKMMSFSMKEEKDYRQEPTESLPNGVPRDGFVESKVSADFAVKVEGPAAKMMGMSSTLGSEELAMFKFFMDSPMAAQMGGAMPQIDELKIGDRKVIDLDFNLTPAVYLTQRLNDDAMDKGKVHKMNALPADLQAKIDKIVADMKKMNLPFFDPSFFQRNQDPPAR